MKYNGSMWESQRYGVAFGDEYSMSSPSSRSQMLGRHKRQSFAESGFGGWADEKMKLVRYATPMLIWKKSHPQHLTIPRRLVFFLEHRVKNYGYVGGKAPKIFSFHQTAEFGLVYHDILICGYRRFSLMRASWVVNCQSTGFYIALRR